MHNRIKQLRKYQHLTQTQFGEQIGVKGNTITNYENKLRTPSDAIILAICREFNVNETWLRTGKGEMFLTQTREEEIEAFVKEIMKDDSDFRRKFISVLANMTTDEWNLLERKATELAEEIKKTSSADFPTAEEEYEKSLGSAPSTASTASNTTDDIQKNDKKQVG